jgi:hypothetical protein
MAPRGVTLSLENLVIKGFMILLFWIYRHLYRQAGNAAPFFCRFGELPAINIANL